MSEQSGSKGLITGEITNNYFEDVDQVNLSVVLRKDGKVVYIDNTFIDNLKVGKAKVFQFSSYRYKSAFYENKERRDQDVII